MDVVVWWLGIVVVALWVFLRPGRCSTKQKAPFCGVNYAHRGLHTKDKTIPENSLAAFRAACQNGYGIELDIQLSQDGEVVVFHDDTLDRVCAVQDAVNTFSFTQLQEMRLCQTSETIPLLTQVFAVVQGRVPIIIELKSCRNYPALCQASLAQMRTYEASGGIFCVESFDPRIVRWFKKHAPDILRGQLAERPKQYTAMPLPLRFALGNVLGNVIARPHFIAYSKEKKPILVQLAYLLGAMRICWTVRPEDDPTTRQAENDGVIFEFYTPTSRY